MAGVRTSVVVTSGPVCDDAYAGTREAFILVEELLANDRSRRVELADFLRTRREALRPQDVGLPGGGRRRTPGLRREEVAQLAGVGTTWYTWLEQGRDVRASQSVLDALADTLGLTATERAHLTFLGRGEPVEAAPEPEGVSSTIRTIVETGLGARPAYLLGRRWDFLAWNDAYAVTFGDPGAMPDNRRNMVWSTFTDPSHRTLIRDWETGARLTVARFRADSARYIGDAGFAELIDAVSAESPEFRTWWRRHEVTRVGHGRKELRHPVAGKLVFEHAVMRLEDNHEQRLTLFTPLPEADTPAKLARLLGG